MGEATHSEIIVAGAGPAGMIAALAFENAGFAVRLIGLPAQGDQRTTALMMPTLTFLGELQLFDELIEQAAPLRTMRIIDATSRLVRSPTVTFSAGEIGEEAFGYNIPNRHLLRVLNDALANRPAIEWRKAMVARWRLSDTDAVAVLDDGDEVAAPLVVAADGRASPARQAAGIRTHQRAHAQSALVLNFAHGREHGDISTEFHTQTGPFTQVPLPGRRSSLVWVVRPQTASRLSEMSDALLSEEIETRMQSMLGKVEVEPGRQVYSLSSAMPSRFGARRVALVGEAAHVFPPIGAQGLNLGIRDIQDIVSTARANKADPGTPAALLRYDARRRPDIFARSAAVNMLNLSLLSDFLPAQFLRSAGLGLLGGFAPLRGFFMHEGLRPGSGWRNLLASLRKEIRR